MTYYQKKRCTISTKHLINILIFISSISLISCDEITNNSEKKYLEISTKRYTSLENAFTDFYAYLGEYSGKSQHCTDVNNIINEFKDMRTFFDNNCKFPEFIKNSEEASFPQSSYQTVRETWNFMHANKEQKFLNEMLNNITKSSFSKDFIRYACDVCEEQWGGAPLGLIITDYEENEIGEITQLDGYYGKKCSGIYTIHMKGLLGMRKKIIRIKVEGSISITKSGTYDFNKINYNFERITD